MSYQIIQPLNQVRLTNVAVVRLARGGHRFEVACYRNKIVNYRQGTETDLSEVLQTERVFTNVSKGQFANSKVLNKCFGTTEERRVCRLILDKGDVSDHCLKLNADETMPLELPPRSLLQVQVSDQERAARLEATAREVASMVSAKCVDAASRRPYTMAQVRDAMKGAGFMVHPTRNVKQQFLECVKLLRKTGALNIERAKMQLAVVLPSCEDGMDGDANMDVAGRRKRAVDLLIGEGVAPSDIAPANDVHDARIVFQLDPSLYRKAEGVARSPSVRGRLEIIQQCVTEVGDVTLGSELERRSQHQQQQQDTCDETGARNAATSADDEMDQLSRRTQATLAVEDRALPSDGEGPRHEQPAPPTTAETPLATNNSRRAQKAAQKKSKKAKRREKEEQAERERRIAAERARREERAARRGDDSAADGGTGGNGDEASAGPPGAGGDGPGATTRACNTCGGAFAPGEYRAHFRSDWHRYNVKLKMRNAAPVSEEEFLLCDSEMCLL